MSSDAAADDGERGGEYALRTVTCDDSGFAAVKGAEADAEQRIDLLYAGSGGEFSAHSLLEHLSVGKVSKRAKLHVKSFTGHRGCWAGCNWCGL